MSLTLNLASEKFKNFEFEKFFFIQNDNLNN